MKKKHFGTETRLRKGGAGGDRQGNSSQLPNDESVLPRKSASFTSYASARLEKETRQPTERGTESEMPAPSSLEQQNTLTIYRPRPFGEEKNVRDRLRHVRTKGERH